MEKNLREDIQEETKDFISATIQEFLPEPEYEKKKGSYFYPKIEKLDMDMFFNHLMENMADCALDVLDGEIDDSINKIENEIDEITDEFVEEHKEIEDEIMDFTTDIMNIIKKNLPTL